MNLQAYDIPVFDKEVSSGIYKNKEDQYYFIVLKDGIQLKSQEFDNYEECKNEHFININNIKSKRVSKQVTLINIDHFIVKKKAKKDNIDIHQTSTTKRIISENNSFEKKKILSSTDVQIIILRQDGKCRMCTKKLVQPGELDHIIPQQLMECHELFNRQLICHYCHRQKTDYIDRQICQEFNKNFPNITKILPIMVDYIENNILFSEKFKHLYKDDKQYV